ncbi:citrate synthase [Capsaspora owczarzaki ATCC 30864]|uniref:Citrate synthase n=1 Tax=Capsaspora owczarzaki (strain ATCC 30864) TaxID=595528 RepID=A0A0D2WQP7_CAPO3|nr:citrate synthase [Capsaspora owczarzaki ATCC 30864]
MSDRATVLMRHLLGSGRFTPVHASASMPSSATASSAQMTQSSSSTPSTAAAAKLGTEAAAATSSSAVGGINSLTVVDNRTGRKYELAIQDGTVRASEFKKMALAAADTEGIKIYDPAYTNTAVARSAISYIDGDKGVLLYRGYPIEELAEKSSFLEVSFLLLYGELPTKPELDHWNSMIMHHTFIHENLRDFMQSFRYDSHPMGMLVSSFAAMSTFHPEANPALSGADIYNDIRLRNKQIHRIMGKVPTIAANAYRHRMGRPFNHPVNHLTYTENFLYMMDRLSESNYRPNPQLARALDILFILHADHEMNCSTAAMRHIASSQVDPYTAMSGAAAALYGPLHGGANEAVLRMLEQIGTVQNVPAFIESVKQKKGKLFGFGHRVYKNYDPRAKIIQRIAYEVIEICGGNEPLIEVAVALEKAALSDSYFIDRKLYPNVDFYSGLIYRSMGFPTDMFPVLFAIPRVAGWLAHWNEDIEKGERRIWRPLQVYVGEKERAYVPLQQRQVASSKSLAGYPSQFGKRSSMAK